tara:strand:- start:76 stop:237 length:162 start_codon:yes stop_codon:yes gene_type:complete
MNNYLDQVKDKKIVFQKHFKCISYCDIHPKGIDEDCDTEFNVKYLNKKNYSGI